MIEVRLVLARGTVGMIEASATTSPSMAWQRPNWSTTAPSSAAASALGPVSPRAWRLLAATFAAGFTLLALEVVWVRFLHLWVLSNSLSFSLVLAVVLLGIGLGSGLAGGWLRRRPDA